MNKNEVNAAEVTYEEINLDDLVDVVPECEDEIVMLKMSNAELQERITGLEMDNEYLTEVIANYEKSILTLARNIKH